MLSWICLKYYDEMMTLVTLFYHSAPVEGITGRGPGLL